ncbi:MAG: pyridoxamine 5'-phosphate oxidase family protein [Chloroflexi bacterium]|nr:pyridoxamine 5'-phosphate oxidase family protein [Chloroflexota bacterium]MBV9596795.1 pyridoxamine 5'-phosphate oxidase family protein [Chloroflexota bacterium]
MAGKQGDLALLQDPVAQELLSSREPARLAYTWADGSPRVIPIWFHWNGRELIMAGPTDAPKIKALRKDPRVAITIDAASSWPYKVLLIRGKARVDKVDGVAPEYAQCAARYFGPEQGAAWVEQIGKLDSSMMRITVNPEWVALLDFEQRFPSAIARRMAAAAG